ncbi:MAG: 3-phosphoshikimate 1-carboxyvinyltransferase [Lachnospiraceae bacterium]|nr:3-phosphoshikimate 1-carboxyvinyltransferase [Lachnospiraceae bacterium]
MDKYEVKKVEGALNGTVVVPGSKSMTNRALLLAALSNEKSILRGVLFSDDSRHFLDSLVSLGFDLTINEKEKTVELQGTGGKIPKNKATINVGSAGTAARFLTAMLALSDGQYEIQCSTQMEKRPMEELINVLQSMGAEFTYLKEAGHLPVKVKGNGGVCKDIDMDISKSTQFLSAMLMVTPVTDSGCNIRITSDKKEGSYISITINMLKSFGVEVVFDGETYHVAGKQNLSLGDYYIEPDVSAACYFYAMAALTGGKITVKNVFWTSVQGDMKFLKVLEAMGCTVTEEAEGITVTGPEEGTLKGVDINMNDFSDQALTLAALAPYATTDTVIRNVGHIRGQECNRMAAIVNELSKCGVPCIEQGDDIFITPAKPQAAEIETYEDHRVAMSFTMLGLKADGIIIDNPLCCRKTFEDYYEVLEELMKKNGYGGEGL